MAAEFRTLQNGIAYQVANNLLRNVTICTYMCRVLRTNSSFNNITAVVNGTGGSTSAYRAALAYNGGLNRAELRAQALDGETNSALTFSGVNLPLAQWIHYAGIFDYANATGTMYIDGVQVGSGTFTSMTPGATSDTDSLGITVGATALFSTSSIVGRVEDVRIYNRRLSDAEIMAINTAMGRDGIVAGLTARFPLNEFGPGVTPIASPNVADENRQIVLRDITSARAYIEGQITHRRPMSGSFSR